MRSRASLALVGLGALLVALTGVPARAEEVPPPRLAFRIHDPSIDESSGLATSGTLPGVVWTVNDSGGRPQVYGLDERGRTVATVTLTGTTNRDWEAVAVGPRDGGGTWLWVGDIGDNLAAWPTVRVYRVPEPSSRGSRAEQPTAYDLQYPDGPRDAETLLVDPEDGRLYVVSKRVQGAAVYRAPARLRSDQVNRLTKVAAAPPLVTDGSYGADGRVALRDYLQAWWSTGVAGPRETVSVPFLPQGESITWTADQAALLVGSEGRRSEVWRVPVAAPAGTPPATSPAASAPADVTPTQAAAADAQGRTSPWIVVAAGLVIGAAGAGVLAAVRRSRAARPRPGESPPAPG